MMDRGKVSANSPLNVTELASMLPAIPMVPKQVSMIDTAKSSPKCLPLATGSHDQCVDGHPHQISLMKYIDGILPKGPYQPCLHMADRALLAGYPAHGQQLQNCMMLCMAGSEGPFGRIPCTWSTTAKLHDAGVITWPQNTKVASAITLHWTPPSIVSPYQEWCQIFPWCLVLCTAIVNKLDSSIHAFFFLFTTSVQWLRPNSSKRTTNNQQTKPNRPSWLKNCWLAYKTPNPNSNKHLYTCSCIINTHWITAKIHSPVTHISYANSRFQVNDIA